MEKLIVLFILISFSNLAAHEVSTQRAPTFASMDKTCPGESVDCLIDYFTKVARDLNYCKIIKVDPKFWKESRKKQPIPEFKEPICPPSEIEVSQIRFMQESASGEFHDLKHDVFGLAYDLKSGKIKIQDLPIIEVWQDTQGRIWTINHRRLIALVLSGTPKTIPVKFVDQETVKKNDYEFTTTNGGSKIFIWITDDLGMLIGNDNRCEIKS